VLYLPLGLLLGVGLIVLGRTVGTLAMKMVVVAMIVGIAVWRKRRA
jgi:hypothetical protein